MIPILYEKTESNFRSNGLGRLSDCIRCLASEERNGIYEVEFDYPVTGVHFEDIQMGRIIACTHDEQGDVQPFDIYAKSEPINGIVTFYAHHISYRLNEITVKPFTAGSCADAISKIKTQSVKANPFTFWTDKSVAASYISETPRKARTMLGGEENSILDVFGTGEYEFDKFDVKLHLHRGQDTNVSIRYGKNLVDFDNNEDASDTYTAVVPFWLGSETEGDKSVSVLITLPEWYITSGHSVPSGREIIVPMDLSGDFDEKPTVTQLRTAAQNRLASSDGWLPSQTITIDFVQLWQTKEYKDYAPLQRLRLCDTCGVFVPMYGMSLRARVIKVVYNVLLDRYDSMELGDKPTTYAAVIEKQFDSKVAGIEQGFQAIKIDIQTVEKNASADATSKANSAEQNAKKYADSGISSLRSDLETQIDAKIETWAQSTNPASAWTTTELRTEHNNDLWLYTGTSNLTVGSVTIKPQGVYKYNGSSNTWSAYSSTSNNLFDLVDGKSTIYYGTTSGTYANKEVGDYLVDSTTGATYRWSGSEWVKQTDYKTYTDGAISTAKQTIEEQYEQAIEDATELIRGGTGGYIVTTVNANGQPIELLITDNLNLNKAVNIWRWNLGGLAHSSNGYDGPFNDVAITQDGKINASMITTGILNANLIRAGIITDVSGKNYWNLETGQFVTTQGKIGSFDIDTAGLLYNYNGQYFKLTEDGWDLLRRVPYSGYGYKNAGIGINYDSNKTPSLSFYSKYNTSGINDKKEVGSIVPYNYFDQGLYGMTLIGGYSSAKSAIYIGSNLIRFKPYGATYGNMFVLEGNKATLNGSLEVNNNLKVYGTKSRLVETSNYEKRLLFAYETPTPLFGDIGEATIDEDGFAYVDIDDIFSETVASRVEYQVFLQAEGEGSCYIAEKHPNYFVIKGTPNLKVAWELKAKQRDYELLRLEQSDNGLEEYGHESDPINDIDSYINEMEALLYG